MRRIRGLPPRGSDLPSSSPGVWGRNGILRLRGDFLQPCRERRAAATRSDCGNDHPRPRRRSSFSSSFGAGATAEGLSPTEDESQPFEPGDGDPGLLAELAISSVEKPLVSLLLLRRPTPMEWGCSYLRRGNQSSVCNGTPSARVFCSLRLSGPEHVCNVGTEPCFFLIFER
jgi:hypothetical protein